MRGHPQQRFVPYGRPAARGVRRRAVAGQGPQAVLGGLERAAGRLGAGGRRGRGRRRTVPGARRERRGHPGRAQGDGAGEKRPPPGEEVILLHDS
ncbi:hypothetical protein SHKM778_54370 [Streptomyces sp. KM77-8]|uniref:Uncharacterized protein n=1 Tax=Streptomyces haneummycinicus TaxID=3074435 RepID=A0AAT9HND3_9ACTN